MSKPQDPLVTAFRALADQQGGVREIATKIKANWQSLDQIYKGVALPSGNPRGIGPTLRQKLNAAYPDWLSLGGQGASNATHTYKPVMEAGQPGVDAYEIAYWDARGSCGGGSHNEGAILKGYLAKEPSWFEKYDVKPQDAIAISADGDSMSDFIVDGDIVIFNRAKTTPRSGSIFLISHPDGLKIKQLRREIDGAWVLESRNPNKQRFPDERIPHESTELLVVKGEFVYRQGG